MIRDRGPAGRVRRLVGRAGRQGAARARARHRAARRHGPRTLAAEVTRSERRAGPGRVASPAPPRCCARRLCDCQLGRQPDRGAIDGDRQPTGVVGAAAVRPHDPGLPDAGHLGAELRSRSSPGIRSSGSVLVALGALDVTDTTGRRVAGRRRGRTRLLRARHALASDAPHAAVVEAAEALAASGGHPRSVTEAAVILAVAADACGDDATPPTPPSPRRLADRRPAPQPWAPFVDPRRRRSPSGRSARPAVGPQPVRSPSRCSSCLKSDRAPVCDRAAHRPRVDGAAPPAEPDVERGDRRRRCTCR